MTTIQQRSVTVTIPGFPMSKARPRFSKGRVYTTPETKQAESDAGWHMRIACSEPLAGPLGLVVEFGFPVPKSWPKKRREAMEAGRREWHVGKPDTDNLLKLVKDSGNGILWHDDAQVVWAEAWKVYASEPATTLRVRMLDGDPATIVTITEVGHDDD